MLDPPPTLLGRAVEMDLTFESDLVDGLTSNLTHRWRRVKVTTSQIFIKIAPLVSIFEAQSQNLWDAQCILKLRIRNQGPPKRKTWPPSYLQLTPEVEGVGIIVISFRNIAKKMTTNFVITRRDIYNKIVPEITRGRYTYASFSASSYLPQNPLPYTDCRVYHPHVCVFNWFQVCKGIKKCNAHNTK